LSDKTEEPTPRRLRKAQEEGSSPISAFASQSVAFLAAVAIAPAAILALATHASGDLRAAVARAADPSPKLDFDPAAIGTSILLLAAPIVGAAAIAAAVTSVVQSGGVVAMKKLAPKLDRLDFVAGLRQLFSATRLMAIGRAALFGAGVGYLAFGILRAGIADLAHTAGRLEQVAVVSSAMLKSMALRTAILGIFLGVVDIVVTRTSWRKKLRMSKDEVRRERKEADGDREIKSARERAHREMLASATITSVAHATVVVTAPHVACALRYDEGASNNAPIMVASGRGDLAAHLIEAARKNGVPIVRNLSVARALLELEIGTAIPEALYEEVAEIIREAWEEKTGA